MPYKKLSDLSDPEALRVLGLLKAHMDSNVGKQMNPFGVLTVVRFLEEQIDVLEAETCLHNTYAIEEKLSEQDGNFAVYLEFTDTALSHVQDLANHMYMNAGEMPLQGFIPDFILDESDVMTLYAQMIFHTQQCSELSSGRMKNIPTQWYSTLQNITSMVIIYHRRKTPNQ